MVGRRLAHYDIKAHLGSGGMGDVYRAVDTRLNRSVALKFLRESDRSPDRLARFQREALALAALNHPHIAAIYGHEEADGETFLAMEFVPGETLAERLRGRPLPRAEAVAIARQIAEALEAAHESGIVHRDLKPANIKITPEGRVKVLDFGLAKVIAGDGASGERPLGSSTATLPATETGVILGTAAYMAPEQARGLPVDRRADIFAFGCVLFEMLAGRRAFDGHSAAEIVARVLEREPDWSLLPADLPASIVRLVHLCLEKDPRRRRQSAGDVRIDLEVDLPAPVRAGAPRRWHVVGFAVTAITAAALAFFASGLRGGASAPVMRLQVATPPTLEPLHFAMSPDGASIVVAMPGASSGEQQLHLRALDAIDAKAIPGTEGARFPFWSPDSKSIGYFLDGKLFRVDVAGGAPKALAPAANPLGGAWSSDGTILFAPTSVSPLLRVPESGGMPVAATHLDAPHQSNHRAPAFLGDGHHFLYYAAGNPDHSGIYLATLDGGTPKRLTAAASGGVYLPPDRVLFVQQGKLVARRLDVARGELTGDPETIAGAVSVSIAMPWVSTSATGMVAYRSGTEAPRLMTWFEPTGRALPPGEDGNAPSLSRDGRYVAFDRVVQGNRDVWVMDLERGGAAPLTRHPAVDGHPVWSPEGSRIAFESQRNGTFDIWIKATGGDAPEEVLLATPNNEWPLDWSTDGRFLLYRTSDEHYSSSDLMALPMTGADKRPIVVANTPFEERIGGFSPDGSWIIYDTDESGRREVVIRPFRRSGGIVHVSTQGGQAPRWSANGEAVYFIAPDGKMMTAKVRQVGTGLAVGKPDVLFPTHIAPQTFTYQYAVSRDGRFLINNRLVEKASASPITLLLNWKR